jgi:hypothetical protein
MQKPYKAEERSGYWICVDTRTGNAVSYPTTRNNAKAEASFMNREYAKALAETVA